MDVIIVCHTEFGFVADEEVIYDKSHKEGVSVGVENLIKLADKYGAKITFAVCPEVADYFPKKTNHEIGLHIHPGWQEYKYKNFKWTVGDEYLKENCFQSLTSTVLRDYSFREQNDLIKKGKECLKEKLGGDPKVFVAGRWSLNNDTVKALIENGFTHDCSALAHNISDHYNWLKLPRICMPYSPNKSDYQEAGDLPILIEPISQALFGGAATPESIYKFGLPWLKACFLEYYNQKTPLFHICLHSPSLTDSYVVSAMDELLGFISRQKDVIFKFASEVKECPSQKVQTNIIPYIFCGNLRLFRHGIKKIIGIKNEEFIEQNSI